MTNEKSIYLLKLVRRLYFQLFKPVYSTKVSANEHINEAGDAIYQLLMNDAPCMIARFGSTELACLSNYLGIYKQKRSIVDYIQGKTKPWWWEKAIINQMCLWSGFFPGEEPAIEKFCQLLLKDIDQVDLLGSWVDDERFVDAYLKAKKVHLRLLEPFWADEPWTRALEGKKILVVHPFSETITAQYRNKDLLFGKPILPNFTLTTIKAVQTIAGQPSEFSDWFEALEYMKQQIDAQDYDICLIGAGAYGFHLAAHVKRLGKKAMHLGGSLQLLFAIRGKRWEDPEYGVKEWGIERAAYSNLMNEYWVRPSDLDKPKAADKVEGACYW